MASSTTVAALVAHLTLNSGQFRRGMHEAAAATKKGTMSMQSAWATLRAGVKVALAYLSARAIYSATVGMFQLADGIQAVAREIGASVEGLQELQFAASTNGSSVEALDKALRQLNMRMGQAMLNAASEGGKALTALGLDINQLAQQPIDQTFRQVAAALAEIPDPSLRARLAMQLFSEAGLEMLRVIDNGRLDAAAERLKEIGGAMTAEDIDRMRAANDAMTELQTAFRNLGGQLAAALGPSTTAFLGMLSEGVGWLAEQLRALRASLVDFGIVMEARVQAFRTLMTTFDADAAQREFDLRVALGRAAAAAADSAGPSKEAPPPFVVPEGGFEAAEKISEAIRDSVPDLAGAMEKGSREAISAIINARRETPELAEAKKQTSLLEEIRRAVEGGRLPDVAAVPI
ncbi:MAG: hypothetical protein ACOY3P_03600 [Planctomycetota bacterium]